MRLEPDVIALWRLNGGIEWAMLLGLAFVAITIGSIILSLGMWFWLLLAAWVVMALLAVVQTIWYPPLAYRHYAYRIAERVIEVRHGVWFRESRLVPLSRIQHVDLRQGLFERSYGLATLVFHTAGMHESSTVLPGLALATATDLRDRLMAQIHGGRPLRRESPHPGEAVSEAGHGG
ncbi:PH domain-containing protein [Chloracidobacterium validum]|uniref:PH domain-containing protein n=2 Tax=Chloracidobacterium validum TaxID=2821543 RepID=A0ABX8BC03_9BACT|nr:PH domain-containing protein [Chloracidobacterium validum]